MMIARTLRSWNEIDDLASEWNDLLERSTSPSIFLTWEWIQSWRSIVTDIGAPHLIVVRDSQERLMGIAPLYQASLRLIGLVNYRTLRIMADFGTGSEYPDWIVAGDVDVEVAEAITQELLANASEWDLIWLTSAAGWTGVEQRIIGPALKSGLPVQSRPCPFSVITLPSEMEDFEGGFSARRRQQMRRNFRQTQTREGVEFVRCDTSEQVPIFLNALFELHQERWQAVGLDGCFKRRPAEAKFYREFAKLAFENDWLAMFAIREKGIFKAVQIGYIFKGRYSQLQEGYDPQYQKGAGNALRYHVIREFIAAGIGEYDFLAGVSEHKRRWSAQVRNGHDILIGSGSLKSRLMFLGGVWPSGRYVKQLGIDPE